MSRKLTAGEKEALKIFTDWHEDEVIGRKKAREFYGRRLLTRLRQAGVMLIKVTPPPAAQTRLRQILKEHHGKLDQ